MKTTIKCKGMILISFALLLFISSFQKNYSQSQDLDTLLFELPDVLFEKIETAKGFQSNYELRIKQPLDHQDPTKGFFFQRVFLSHKGFAQPTVMVIEGYDRSENKIHELTELLNANQVLIEHRYFGKSVPDSMDYQFLNLKQVAGDLHHIKQLFKKLYTSKWVSIGRSKGGATTLFYKYFYPDDVDASVQYVGPINRTLEEPRLYKFLDTIGTDLCRKKIKSFQTFLLKNRKHILPLLKAYNLGAKLKYAYLSEEEAFEYWVMEYPFAFWQYGHDCNKIPNGTTSYFENVKYLLSVSDISLYSDEKIKGYGSHYYQSATEMGYYGYRTKEFKGLLKVLPTDHNPQATFLPNKMKVTFDDSLLKKINSWLPEHGNHIIHIYGMLDTWTASAVPPSEKVDAVWFFMKGKHHSNALVSTMNNEEKEKFFKTLERWLSIKIAAQ